MKTKNIIMQYLKNFFEFIGVLYTQRYVIFQLTRRDFKNMYLSSYLGLPWAFLQPVIFILVMWFIIEMGFRVSSVGNEIPFGLWLICGMVPWFFLINSILVSSNSLIEYSFLIKKIFFRSSIIPLIKIISALIIHTVLVVLVAIFAVMYGYHPDLYWIQLPYYLLVAVILVIGISWFVSSINVFVRDAGQFISVVMQIGFWVTPIFWYHGTLKGNLVYIAYLNPFFYIINGYRETFIFKVWFFEHMWLNVYFWFIMMFCFVGGALVFNKLRPHFADVL